MSNFERTSKPAGAGGFTVLEVLIAMSLSLLILAAVLGTFIFLARGSLRFGHYSEMEQQARRALHQFSQDARQADHVSWSGTDILTFKVSNSDITYVYDGSSKTFSRAEASQPPIVLVSGVSDFSFKAYQPTGAPAPSGAVAKMVQVNLNLARSQTAVGTSTGQIISARCVLRNKKLE